MLQLEFPDFGTSHTHVVIPMENMTTHEFSVHSYLAYILFSNIYVILVELFLSFDHFVQLKSSLRTMPYKLPLYKLNVTYAKSAS